MHNLAKDYNRAYYWQVFKLNHKKEWSYTKLDICKAFLWCCYKLDSNFMSELTGKKWK